MCPAGHTLTAGAGACLVCSQNMEYEENLAFDRARRLREEAEAREQEEKRREDMERQQLEQKEDDAADAKVKLQAFMAASRQAESESGISLNPPLMERLKKSPLQDMKKGKSPSM